MKSMFLLIHYSQLGVLMATTFLRPSRCIWFTIVHFILVSGCTRLSFHHSKHCLPQVLDTMGAEFNEFSIPQYSHTHQLNVFLYDLKLNIWWKWIGTIQRYNTMTNNSIKHHRWVVGKEMVHSGDVKGRCCCVDKNAITS